MALFAGESTAWEDMQVKMGNFAPRDPKSPSNEERFKETMQRADCIVKQDFVDSLLTQAAEESTTEDFDLVALRQARLEQLMKQDSQATVRRITKESYIDEVTVGSKRAIIVVMMDRGGGSSFLESSCRKFAKEWTTDIAPTKGFDSIPVRFYVGDVDDLIGTGFPAESLPFAVVYSEGFASLSFHEQRPMESETNSSRSLEQRERPPLGALNLERMTKILSIEISVKKSYSE